MAISEYDDLDATAMADLVRKGAVQPCELHAEAIARIERLNPVLNAVVHAIEPVYPGSLDGAFAGVPLLLKNIGIAVAGSHMSVGTRLLENQICTADNTLAGRYRAAGFVFTGRTNTPEFALSFTSESVLHGAARNPWDLARTAGGSSGGSASAVAAGIVPMAQSSDGAGSTRVPAAHNGVFGFKPSRMLNPVGPQVAEGIAGMSTPHAISRSVRDSALLLDVGSGADLGDPYCAPAVARSFMEDMQTPRRGLKIGLCLQAPLGLSMDQDCVDAAQSAATLCEELGHHVEITTLEHEAEALKAAWRVVGGVSVARSVDAIAAMRGLADADSYLEPVNQAWIREGRSTAAGTYLGAVETLHRTSRSLARFFQTYDVFLSPTTAQIAPKLGYLAGDGLGVDVFFDRFWAHAPLTAMFNASGCPAMSVPLHWTAAGLPVGAHFGAGFGRDGLLFSLARQLEIARPWFNRRPQLKELQA